MEIKNDPSSRYKSKIYTGDDILLKTLMRDLKQTNIKYCPKYILDIH